MKFRKNQLVQICPEYFSDVHRTTRLINGKFALAGGVMVDAKTYERLIKLPAKIETSSNGRILLAWDDEGLGLWIDPAFVQPVVKTRKTK